MKLRPGGHAGPVLFRRVVKMRIGRKTMAMFVFVCGMILTGLSGCHREDPNDERTLEKRPHTETVKPVDRSDAFRP
jgi:hypothetical protein